MSNFKMDWEFRTAEEGNIALTGEIDLPSSGEFTIAVACGGSYRAQPRSCFNRWPSRLSRIAKGMSASGSARS
jgi:hypothetical protein